MIIMLDGAALTLIDGDDFSRFSLLYRSGDTVTPGNGPGNIEVESEAVAWVPIATVVRLRGDQATPVWMEQLNAMVDKARPHGWIDDEGQRIRAHIETGDPAQR